MKSFHERLRRCFCLSPRGTALAALLGFGAMGLAAGLTALLGRPLPALEYPSYVAGFYALVVLALGFPGMIRWVREKILGLAPVRRLYSTQLGRLLMDDLLFRADLSLYRGMAIHFIYALFKLLTAIWCRSVWFGAVGGYYIVAGGIRLYLIHCARQDKLLPEGGVRERHRLRTYRNAGWMMLGLDLTMLGMIVQMVWQNRSYVYPGTVVYLSAVFTFYTLILAIVNLVKYRRQANEIYTASKILNLAGALLSILALQTALLARFSGPGEMLFRRLINAAVGGVVSLAVAATAVCMIVSAGRRLKD